MREDTAIGQFDPQTMSDWKIAQHRCAPTKINRGFIEVSDSIAIKTIRKKGRNNRDFWRMFRLFSTTGRVVVVDEGNIRHKGNMDTDWWCLEKPNIPPRLQMGWSLWFIKPV